METKHPFSWIRKLADRLIELDGVPLYGNAPSFDWERLSTLLSSRFSMPELKLGEKKQSWRLSSELKEGLGESCLVIPLKLSPLEGHAFWMMPREQVAKFTSWMLSGKGQAQPLSSEILAEGFYHFLILQILDAASALDPFQKISMSLSEEPSMHHADAFCVDITLSFEKRSCWGRLIIEPKLQKSWVEHFSSDPANLIQSKAAAGLELSLSLQVGSLSLQKKEWQSFKKGDFAPLRKGYDAEKHAGHASLMLGNIPLFQVKIKSHKIHLLDDPFTYEETMEKHPEELPTENQPEEPISLKELPIQITVEMARIKMTLEKLLQLAPGNMLEIPVDPNQTVRLTVDGQLIGRAELVHLGNTLGIRLLEKG
jgi:flagellar motor switch protein FliN/FliY